MSKRNKIIYWVATIWMCLGMASTGIVQIMQVKEEVDMMNHLGYPAYFMTLIGVWKLLGVVVVLIPKYPVLKEWAYAGFFFTMSGATISHLIKSDPIADTLPPVFLLLLIALSYFFRPANRKPVTVAA
ncbi:DoxX family protein [Chitinophaga deserti]|uniref:DoxX family protein n=1 Tax=Chitinophaga deserti TaxID=2164099 RepID=UPI000D6B1A1C|nr:DoxX family protein [Chitinophaga deserti]